MSRYKKYLQEIEGRKTKGLQPKPIDAAELLDEIIDQIKDEDHEHRINSINFFIYNVLPGTTAAARVKKYKFRPGTKVFGRPVSDISISTSSVMAVPPIEPRFFASMK